MTLTRWETYRDVLALQNRMNNIFQDFSRGNSGENELVTAAGFVPPVDIYEDEHKLVLKLEIPGMRQKDLDVRDGKQHPVREGRAQASKVKGRKRTSIAWSAATVLSIALSRFLNTIDPESIKAEYDAGVLQPGTARSPKASPSRSR